MAATGASLSTIDAKLKFPPNTLNRLLQKGRDEDAGPYKDFYLLFRSWAAEARHAAEASMAKKSPDKWLDRNTTAKILESEEDHKLALEAPSNNQQTSTGVSKEKLLESMKELLEMGISIDDALRNNKLEIAEDEDE